MTPKRLRILQNLANNGGSILWDDLSGGEKANSAYLRSKRMAELSLDAKANPSIMRLHITDTGRAAIGRAT